jgi:glutathione S-transferase
MDTVELVGRSSSHFTRVARIFALELAVPHRFRAVLDLTTLDANAYAGHPALKVPTLIDERGPLFGTENICRALLGHSGKAPASVVMRGDTTDRVVANAEELVLHVMSSEVGVIMARASGPHSPLPPKLMPSMVNSLRYLDEHLDAALAALPPTRALSFLEVSLFCLVPHLTFREILDVSPFKRLVDFCAAFDARESAQATPYHFDRA